MSKLVGIVGSGQLAKMLAIDALHLGQRVLFWPCGSTSAIQGLSECADPKKITFEAFCDQVDIVVIDHEHIDDELIDVMEQCAPYHGNMKCLRMAKDRLMEKAFLRDLNVPTLPFFPVASEADLGKAVVALDYPFILKQRTQAYDGKGQYIIHDHRDFENAAKQIKVFDHVAEKFIAFDNEYSVVSVRDQQGEVAHYDMTRNVHEDGILISSEFAQSTDFTEKAQAYNRTIMDACQYVGVLAVEYFSYQGQLVVNEISPRVHNTGHWTLDAAVCSQFQNHIRVCLGMPIGSTQRIACMKMYNIIGDRQQFDAFRGLSHAMLYDYAKTERPKRKLGHVTVLEPV